MRFNNQSTFNGRQITNVVDRPVLHKKGKQWITIGLSTLLLAGLGTVATTSGVHAANIQNNNVNSNNINKINNNATPNSAKPSTITSQATNLHKQILNNSAMFQHNNSSATKPTVAPTAKVNPNSTSSNSTDPNSNNVKSNVGTTSNNNSDSNASTPNYIENKVHYNLGSYNSRNPVSTEAQSNAYQAYIKANPQLANLYNKTANQSESNVVSNLANNKRNKPLMKLGDAQTEQYSITPKFEFKTGGLGTVVNKNIQPSAYTATAIPGSTESFDITKFFGGSKIGNTYALANPNQTVSVKFGNNGQFNWVGDNTFHWVSQKSAPVSIQYPDGSQHTFYGYIDDPITQNNHISAIGSNGKVQQIPLPNTTALTGISNGVTYTDSTQSLNQYDAGWNYGTLKNDLPINIEIVDGYNPSHVLEHITGKTVTATKQYNGTTWNEGDNSNNDKTLSSGNNTLYFTCGSEHVNWNSENYKGHYYNLVQRTNTYNDSLEQVNTPQGPKIVWHDGTPTFIYVKQSPAMYNNAPQFHVADDAKNYFTGKLPNQLNNRFYAQNGEVITIPATLNASPYTDSNPILDNAGVPEWYYANNANKSASPLKLKYVGDSNSGHWQWITPDTMHLKINRETYYVNYIDTDNNKTIKSLTYSNMPDSGPTVYLPWNTTFTNSITGQTYQFQAIPDGYTYDYNAEKRYHGYYPNQISFGPHSNWMNNQGTKDYPANIYVKGNTNFYTVHSNGQTQTYQYKTGLNNKIWDLNNNSVDPNSVPSPSNPNSNQLVVNYYDENTPNHNVINSVNEFDLKGTAFNVSSDVPSNYIIDKANNNAPDLYIFGQQSSKYQQIHGIKTMVLNVPVEKATKPASDAINSASSLVNSDLTKVQYLASADSNDKFATSQVNSINNDVSSIKADINNINGDRATENSSNATNEIVSANNAYDNAYSANAAIESLMNTSLSTDSSEIGSLSTLANNNSKAIDGIKRADGQFATDTQSLNSLSNEANSLEDLNLNSGTALKSQINSMENSLTQASSAISWVQGSSSAITNSLENELISSGSTNSSVINSLERASNATSQALTDDENKLYSGKGTVYSLNNEITALSTSANTNHANDSQNATDALKWINDNKVAILSATSSANTAYTNASNAISSLTSEDGRISANSNAITSLKNNDITPLSNELNSASGLKEQINSIESAIGSSNTSSGLSALAHDYNVLNNDIYGSNSIASQVNNANSWVNNNGSTVSNEAKSASDKANADSTAISHIQDTLSNYSNVSASANSAMSSLTTDSSALSWLVNSLNSVESETTQASSNAQWIKDNNSNVATLNSGWSSVENDIGSAKSTLQNAIDSKANQSDLTNDIDALDNAFGSASSLANTANQLATKNSGEIANLKNNTAITITFTNQSGQRVATPITMTNGYVEQNAQSDDGNNTYDITNLLNTQAPVGQQVAHKYTITLGTNSNGVATMQLDNPTSAPKTSKKGVNKLGLSAPEPNNAYNTFTIPKNNKAWNFVQAGLNRKNLTANLTSTNNIELMGNPVEYKGNIILNFGSKQTTVPYDASTISRNGKNDYLRNGDKVNLLNYAENVAHKNKPSDFANDDLISGFDTTGFKYTGTDNSQYDFEIQPADAQKQSGNVHTHDITLNFSANTVPTTIQYMYNGHKEGSTLAHGTDDAQANWTSTTGINPNWHLANAKTNTITYSNNGTVNVNVIPNQATDTINYVDGNKSSANYGKAMGTQTFTGNVNAGSVPTDAGNTSFDVNNSKPSLPTGYELSNKSNTFNFDGQTHIVYVNGVVHKKASPTDPTNPFNKKNTNNPVNPNSKNNPTNSSNSNGTTNPNNPNSPLNKSNKHHNEATGKGSQTNPWNPNSKNSPFNPSNSDSPFNPNSPINPNKTGGNDDPTNPNSPVDPQNPDSPLNPSKPNSPLNPKNNSYEPNNSKNDPWQPTNSDSPLNPTSPISPYNPSNPNSPLNPNGTQANYNAKNGVATIIVAEFINGKQIGGYSTTQDESNMTTGEQATIKAPSVNGYSVNGSDSFTATMKNDGSLSNGTHQFNYNVNANDIAPITITYKNQNGSYIDTKTGSDLGNSNIDGKATITLKASDLAKLGAVGDYVDITGINPTTNKDFFSAPEGYSFKNKDNAMNGVTLNHIQLARPQVSLGNPLGAIRLFAMVPTRITPKPTSNSNSVNASVSASAASAETSASNAVASAKANESEAISENDSVNASKASQSAMEIASMFANNVASASNAVANADNTSATDSMEIRSLIAEINTESKSSNSSSQPIYNITINNEPKVTTNKNTGNNVITPINRRIPANLYYVYNPENIILHGKNNSIKISRRKGFTGRIIKATKFNGKRAYVVRWHHKNYVVNAKEVRNAYIQVKDFNHMSHGLIKHATVVLRKNAKVYKSIHFSRTTRLANVKAGSKFTVVGVKTFGKKGYHQTRLVLSTGCIITANRNYVKFV